MGKGLRGPSSDHIPLQQVESASASSDRSPGEMGSGHAGKAKPCAKRTGLGTLPYGLLGFVSHKSSPRRLWSLALYNPTGRTSQESVWAS